MSLFPFDPIGKLLGFWGQSGAFVFHDPQRNLYFAGTVNRLSNCLSCQPSAVSAMIRIMRAVR